MCSVRAFLAIALKQEIKNRLADLQSELRAKVDNVRWSNPENLHLTLHFFGDTSQENLEKIKASMLSVKRNLRPFKVSIRGLGGFPGLQRSRVVWLGLEPQAKLIRLHREIQYALQEVGLSPDTRLYSPHLTIGRARRASVDLSKVAVTLNDTTLGDLEINQITLYESRLKTGGAEHIPLLTVNFDEEADNLS